MERDLFDGGEDSEHVGVGFVEISIKILSDAGWSSLWIYRLTEFGPLITM